MVDVLRSRRFDDVYFSAEGGLEETRHVFLQGNDLPVAWQDRHKFTIAETGFGTGLNFLAAWALFDRTARADAQLDFISVERFPLARAAIKQALEHWRPQFGGRLEKLLQSYPVHVPGFHRINFGNVFLTLVFDDVNKVLPQINAGVDAWFLDGFSPSKNPEMWSDTLFEQMKRLTAPGGTVSTFTAAGRVKRGLEAAGFSIEKKKGFGRKRDMLTGKFPRTTPRKERRSKRIAVIGGGLAGTACAYVLKQRGHTPVIYEMNGLAAGASGNPAGIYNPRLSAQRIPQSDFYTAAFALGLRTFGFLDADFDPCGSLHLINDDQKRKRFESASQTWGWSKQHMRLMGAKEASEVAGTPLNRDALFLPDSGVVSPQKLCAAYARDIEVVGCKITDLDSLRSFDTIILACADAVKNFPQAAELPVHTVRGQITYANTTPVSQNLKTNLCYGGYISPAQDRRHLVGSTFQKWLTHTNILEEDHADNLLHLKEAAPDLELQAEGGRAALRASSTDRFPIIGEMPDQKGLYVSTAHGSHGTLSTLAGAHLLADLIGGEPLSLPGEVVNTLSPQRFFNKKNTNKTPQN